MSMQKMFTAKCDACGGLADGSGHDSHEAKVNARSQGWRFHRGQGGYGGAMATCPKCQRPA